MRIGEAAAAAGLTPKALRFYEQQGLLPPAARSANGYRDYPPATLARLRFIRRGRAAGLTLAEIRDILRTRDAGQPPCAHVADRLARQLTALDRQIAELTARRATVAEHYETAAHGEPSRCDAQQICSYL
ncbi:heavy metal-responsive transcriptional regulator [Brachybacterium sp. J144]|uniref:heavy metal-responsive transcriptional regulator n=1 Tax=Brachybacterium sp. J144 TaxID=3116487 RepID=UPI002E78E077|nr:heavy metal-responsive transcriptional regulator [Brachybacterium sp. J144]MEE1649867.1 heavy metal-responsive transcriptional regulator [Brachybacterium sp. J144]